MPSRKQPAADAVDEQLARYRSMRDFGITAEPSGTATPAKKSSLKKPSTTQGLPFVIQKHAASHLHYDFRLGWNGVLKSWACAKGPSYVVKDRRLAVQVEDHPMEYGGFEGIIPVGQYGGGTVMVWDQGTWWPQPGHENVDAGLRDGSLKFVMSGTKMHGKWTLIRMNSKPGEKGSRWSNSSKPNWLLIKEHDDFERPADAPAITDAEPNSAVTNRSLDQIAAQEDHVWQSNKTAYLRDPSIKVPPGQAWHRNDSKSKATASTSSATPKKSPKANNATELKTSSAKGSASTGPQKGIDEKDKGSTAPPHASGTLSPTLATQLKSLPREAQPAFIKPQLALEATTPPETANWLHELKLDGYRIQARKSTARNGKSTVQMLTRSGLDWTHRVPLLAAAVAALPAANFTLDGEAVVLSPDGTSNFANLQASFQDGATNPLTYFAFDLLHLDGHNPRSLPLRERKNLLAQLLPPDGDEVRLSEHLETSGAEMFRHACELHAEGIISKRADAPYKSGRSGDWLKAKCLHEQEFVIAGFTLSSDGNDRIGSLLLGYYEGGPHKDGSPHPERSEGPPRFARSASNPKSHPHLIYAGRTGTGFTQKLKRDLFTQLSALKLPSPSFAHVPADARRGVTWVKPTLVAQVRFATWTADDLVRQAAFLGLREDKHASEVVREEPTVAPRPKSSKPGKATAKDTEKALQEQIKQPVAVRLTHPQKILDPESGLTKQQLLDYYTAVAERMLPYISDRPLSLVRCPDGAAKPCFFQKHVNSMLPKDIGSVAVPDKKTGKIEQYITLNTPAQLIALAQLGVLEIHPWSSKNNNLEHPDHLIFDLDPDETISWPTLCAAASEVRKRLKAIDLECFLKLTGGKGLHIVAPIAPTHTWTEIKDFTHQFVLAMERKNPRLYLTKMSKAARKDKIYLDYLRNERGATAVAPYSPRARLGVHVSLPLPWSALKQPTRPVFSAQDFTSWKSRLKTDPWKALLSTTQQLVPKKLHNI
jgi:bifunctional non-homologous end joining protein LigD